MKKIVLIGGGTVSYVRNHLALCAPAYGSTVNELYKAFIDSIRIQRQQSVEFNTFDKISYPSPDTTIFCNSSKLLKESHKHLPDLTIQRYLTRMAGGGYFYSNSEKKVLDLETNSDVSKLVDDLIADKSVRVIIFNPALVDFDGKIGDVDSGKYADRLKTKNGPLHMELSPTDKIIGRIRKERKDIFVVGFKTTTNASSDEQYKIGLELLKKNSLNLVLANDTVTRNNMIIAPEETRYAESVHRSIALHYLVDIVLSRMQNTFTRSTVLDGNPVDWNSELIPDNLRQVVNHCIKKGAYKPVLGKTAGHFAVKLNDGEILTSIRKTNFNELEKVGLVRVEYDGIETVKAYGAKPSVGGMSQRIIFTEHKDAECIVHFHCPTKNHIVHKDWVGYGSEDATYGEDFIFKKDKISIKPQWINECGSTQCGMNTSKGLAKIDLGDGHYVKAVYLDDHGPNIVFSKDVPAEKIISYIDSTFNLSSKTGGLII